MRERLPDRRKTIRQKIKINDNGKISQSFYLDLGLYPDGRLGEIWIEAFKEGTFAKGVLSAVGRLTSLCLQCKVEVSEIVHTLKHINFEPRGDIQADSTEVKTITSIIDYIAQEIEIYHNQWLKQQEVKNENPQ